MITGMLKHNARSYHTGPYYLAHQEIRRHAGLVGCLNAVQVRTGFPIAEIVLRICLQRWLPEYRVTVQVPAERCPSTYVDDIMLKLRGLQAAELAKGKRVGLSRAICGAIWDWDVQNLAYVDGDGAAIFVGEPGTKSVELPGGMQMAMSDHSVKPAVVPMPFDD